jgi:Right handed beta helix region
MVVVIRHGRLTGAAAFAWPDETNTGPTGELTAYSGPTTIATDGALIENKIYSGPSFLVTGNNVTFRNCQITSTSFLDFGINVSGLNCTIEDCRFLCTASSGLVAINKATTVTSCDISGFSNGIVLGVASTIRRNYIHDLNGDHDGIQTAGNVVAALVEDNTIMVSGSGTSCVRLISSAGAIDDVTINHNYLGGAAVTPMNVTKSGGGTITYVTITNNHIEEGSSGYIVISVADQSSFFIEGNVDALTGDPV